MEGIILTLMAIVDPGDEVIIGDPAYTNYEAQIRLLNGQPVTVTLDGQVYSDVVTSNAWSVTIPAAAVGALADGSFFLTAAVSDLAGNAATPASTGLDVDTTADATPAAVLDVPDLTINAVEAPSVSFTVSGLDADASGVVTFSDGRSLYHTGDTWIFSDMALIQEIHAPEIILIQAGGGPYSISLNAKANGRMITERLVDGAHFHPAASNDGTAAGAALYLLHSHHRCQRTPELRHAYLGREYSDRQIEQALADAGLAAEPLDRASLLACAAAGGLSVTVNSILILPTPPAIFRIDHLWQNLTNVPPYTWDQVKLTPLSTAFPILYIAVGAVFLGTILQRRLPSSLAESPLLWILLASAFATLILLLAKSLNYTWYLIGAAIIASLTLLIIANSPLGRRGILMIAAIALIAGMPATFQNVQAEIRKRALVLDGTARSSALISTAHQLCQGNNAHIILDMLIPAPESSAQHVIPLRDAVRMADVKEDIAHKRPIIFISHEHMLTDFSPAERRLIEPVNAHFAIIRHSAHPGYLFRIGDGCRQK